MAIVLCAIGGLLLGGAWSLRGQGRSAAAVGITAAGGLLALAAGILWLL